MDTQAQINLIRQVNRSKAIQDNLPRPEVSRQLVAPFLDLPGKVGLWYAGDVQRSTGNMYDTSSQGRTLTYTGNPTVNQLSNGIAYWDYDGTGDYHTRANEADLRIPGNDSWYAVPGITMCGWFWFDSVANDRHLMGTHLVGTGLNYILDKSAGGDQIAFTINGGATSVTSSVSCVISTWYFVAGRYVPSTSVDIWVSGTKDSTVAAIPATNTVTGLAFTIGAESTPSRTLDGRYSIGGLFAHAIPDVMINRLFNQTRVLFGV